MMGKAVMPALQRIDWRFGVINGVWKWCMVF